MVSVLWPNYINVSYESVDASLVAGGRDRRDLFHEPIDWYERNLSCSTVIQI